MTTTRLPAAVMAAGAGGLPFAAPTPRGPPAALPGPREGGGPGGVAVRGRDAGWASVRVARREGRAVEPPPGRGEAAGARGADGEDHGVELLAQLRGRHVDAHVDAEA